MTMTEADIKAALDGTFTVVTQSFGLAKRRVPVDFLPTHQARARRLPEPIDVPVAEQKPYRAPVEKSERELIIALHRQGKNSVSIGAATGRSSGSIRAWLRQWKKECCT